MNLQDHPRVHSTTLIRVPPAALDPHLTIAVLRSGR